MTRQLRAFVVCAIAAAASACVVFPYGPYWKPEAVGGTLSIFSKPGFGTRLVAQAPLVQQARENAG